MKSWKNYKNLIIKLIAAGVIFFVGWTLGKHKIAPAGNFKPLRAPESANFKFINPLIGFDTVGKEEFPEFKNVKAELVKNIAKVTDNRQLKDMGLYFRELKNGHWFGINENGQFSPGSIFKVPIMIAYFEKAETDPSTLDKKILYNPTNLPQPSPNADPPLLTLNRWYTTDELIKAMIIKSDNGAKDFLLNNLTQKYLEEVLYDMGFSSINETNLLTPRTYASLFRRLYNSTFLNREYSEKALAILSETEFKNGLSLGISADVKVSHKFGARYDYEEGNITAVELHDCGIIYYPSSPYLLCIMTRGYNVEDLQKIIGATSKIIFEFAKNGS